MLDAKDVKADQKVQTQPKDSKQDQKQSPVVKTPADNKAVAAPAKDEKPSTNPYYDENVKTPAADDKAPAKQSDSQQPEAPQQQPQQQQDKPELGKDGKPIPDFGSVQTLDESAKPATNPYYDQNVNVPPPQQQNGLGAKDLPDGRPDTNPYAAKTDDAAVDTAPDFAQTKEEANATPGGKGSQPDSPKPRGPVLEAPGKSR